MSEPFWRLFAALSVALVATLSLAWCISGCAAAKPAAEAAYLAEHLRCIEEASTRPEADTCRAAVRARWADGGGQ